MAHNSTLIFILVLLSGCERASICKDDDLNLRRIDYSVSQLRTDGYFFGAANPTSSVPFANIYYLYRNGVFFTTEADDLDRAVVGTIEVDIANKFGQQIKSAWGIFQVNGNVIEIERWRSRANGCEGTIYEKGEIVNDSTFLITLREYRDKGKAAKSETPNSVFYFRPLIQKPDSTNNFIR
jgi:hypothetical protein